uniref:Uncharacterized protein n=1 Tax=Myotis myotis TaxID=51298 RepID=A0A7J7SSH8_MYOMY|nr:hypothetical protein mMyoMyo1_009407 [Myotis myotis]
MPTPACGCPPLGPLLWWGKVTPSQERIRFCFLVSRSAHVTPPPPVPPSAPSSSALPTGRLEPAAARKCRLGSAGTEGVKEQRVCDLIVLTACFPGTLEFPALPTQTQGAQPYFWALLTPTCPPGEALLGGSPSLGFLCLWDFPPPQIGWLFTCHSPGSPPEALCVPVPQPQDSDCPS